MPAVKSDREFWHRLPALVIPIAFQQLMLALVSACDAVMLGALGQTELSAASLAGQITFVYNLFLAALTIGASMFAAQFWGKGDAEAVERLLGLALRASLVASAAFFAAALFLPTGLMRLFTPDAALVAHGAGYLRAVALSYLFCGVSQIYLCIMKNTGHAMGSMVISSVTVALNILLNALFIFGLAGAPALGVAGAAVATTLARALELFMALAVSRKPGRIPIRLCHLALPDAVLRRAFWRRTLPVLGNELVWGVGFTMYSVILGHLGSDAVAANSIATVVKNLIACFCLGLGSGGGILVGNELGAGRPGQAKRFGGKLCTLAVLGGAVTGAAIVAASPLILRAVQLTPTAAGYLRAMLWMCSYYMVGKSINSATISGIFCAGGDSHFGFACDAVTMWCVTVPLGMLAAFVWKWPVIAVFFIISLDEMVKLPAVWRHYKKYLWVKDLTEEGSA